MDTNPSFSLLWGKKKLIASMSIDYDRGLLMLKDYLETGSVHSRMEEFGVVTFPSCKYIGVTTECSISEMKEQMQNDRHGLSLFVEEDDMDVTGESFTIYHKWDLAKEQVAFTVGIPVADELVGLESPFHAGKIPKLKAFKIIHEGPYRHLGNAWSLGNMMARNKEIKFRKGYPPFEVYNNDPQDTADEFLETDLYFPLEG
jgi:effector-binding domain-containing protein